MTVQIFLFQRGAGLLNASGTSNNIISKFYLLTLKHQQNKGAQGTKTGRWDTHTNSKEGKNLKDEQERLPCYKLISFRSQKRERKMIIRTERERERNILGREMKRGRVGGK